MNTDASGFSLEVLEKALKPRLKNLSFKRVSDFKDIHEVSLQIGAVCYRLTCWERHMVVPADINLTDKAVAIDITDLDRFRSVWEKPASIDWLRLLLISPRSDSPTILWAVQMMTFTQQIHADYCYLGKGAIVWVDKETFPQGIQLPDNFPARCWKQVRKLIAESSKVREEALTSLRELDVICAVEESKSDTRNAATKV